MSSYPDAFRINCVGKLPCNTNYNACSDEPIVLENRKPIQNHQQVIAENIHHQEM